MNKTPDICGRMSQTPFATYDPDGSCWRTSEATLFSDSPLFSANFPPWGMTRGGDAFERLMSERPTVANDSSSLLGTPNAHPRTHTPRDVHHGMQLANQVASLPTPTARDWKGQNQRNDATCLPGAMALLPTPTVQASKHGSTADTTANAHGYNLWDLPHLLPTPTAGDALGSRNSTAIRRPDSTGHPGDTLTDAAWKITGIAYDDPRSSMAVQLLPTPRTSDANGAGNHGTGGPDLRTAISGLTPQQSSDGSVSCVEPPLNLSMTGDD